MLKLKIQINSTHGNANSYLIFNNSLTPDSVNMILITLNYFQQIQNYSSTIYFRGQRPWIWEVPSDMELHTVHCGNR